MQDFADCAKDILKRIEALSDIWLMGDADDLREHSKEDLFLHLQTRFPKDAIIWQEAEDGQSVTHLLQSIGEYPADMFALTDNELIMLNQLSESKDKFDKPKLMGLGEFVEYHEKGDSDESDEQTVPLREVTCSDSQEVVSSAESSTSIKFKSLTNIAKRKSGRIVEGDDL